MVLKNIFHARKYLSVRLRVYLFLGLMNFNFGSDLYSSAVDAMLGNELTNTQRTEKVKLSDGEYHSEKKFRILEEAVANASVDKAILPQQFFKYSFNRRVGGGAAPLIAEIYDANNDCYQLKNTVYLFEKAHAMKIFLSKAYNNEFDYIPPSCVASLTKNISSAILTTNAKSDTSITIEYVDEKGFPLSGMWSSFKLELGEESFQYFLQKKVYCKTLRNLGRKIKRLLDLI